ncbi:MAG: envelope stress response membrane protein PspC [Gammaproteobacteria bacterium]|jgi:phage shock protein C|nr:envelope stress response membrane protein PspC [Gammaproteobacteria bacterium]
MNHPNPQSSNRQGPNPRGPNPQAPNPRRLYRDTDNAVFAGVCAGIADYFGISTKGLRWLTALGTLFFLPPLAFLYVIAAFLLPRKPEDLYHDEFEETFWRSVRRDPHFTFDDLKRQFRQLDRRLQSMEKYVTSPRFDLDQEFKNL